MPRKKPQTPPRVLTRAERASIRHAKKDLVTALFPAFGGSASPKRWTVGKLMRMANAAQKKDR